MPARRPRAVLVTVVVLLSLVVRVLGARPVEDTWLVVLAPVVCVVKGVVRE